MKFCNKIGFGKHEEKNQRLKEMVNRYKQIPIKERYKNIIDIVKSKGNITSKDIIASGIKPFYTYFLLRNLTKAGILNVDKSNKIFIYSLDKGKEMRKELEDNVKKL